MAPEDDYDHGQEQEHDNVATFNSRNKTGRPLPSFSQLLATVTWTPVVLLVGNIFAFEHSL